MKPLALWLFPLALLAGQSRYARVGDLEGQVEVQHRAADPWQPALRNMPISELAWVRTAASSRVELELDEGSILRLGPDSLAELSDYTRLSTGQRITLVSLDHGLGYVTGASEGKDALILAVPGAEVRLRRNARLRLEAREQWSQIASLEGAVRFSSPTAEFDLTEGQLVRLDPAHPAKFFLYREVPALETDRWNDERDKVLAQASSGAHVPSVRYGLADLDAHGTWIQSSDLGTVWKPKMPEAWAPFRTGKWLWYEGLGYTWIADEPWGWLPYHYGRWMQQENTGWVWAPGKNAVFKPGEVYWLRAPKLVGWGPLAPGEAWAPPAVPRLFLNVNTTYARFAPEAREIDPAGFNTRPPEPLATAAFVLALPSPAFLAARLDAQRPVLRAGSTRIVPVMNGVTFESPPEPAVAAVPAPPPANAGVPSTAAAYMNGPSAEQPVVIVTNPPPEPPEEIYYPVPVYTGIIVVNPPEHKDHDHDKGKGNPPPSGNPSPNPPKAVGPPAPGTTPINIPRGEQPPHHPTEPPRPKPSDSDKPAK